MHGFERTAESYEFVEIGRPRAARGSKQSIWGLASGMIPLAARRVDRGLSGTLGELAVVPCSVSAIHP